MATIKDEAVVVRLWDFSETSQTAWLFSREHGLIRGLAKGAKRTRSKFGGGMDLLTRGECVAIVKSGGAMATLTEWDLQEVFWAPRRSLHAHRTSMYLADLCGVAITDHDPHPAMYAGLVEALRAGEDERSQRLAALRFQWTTLLETGYRPTLDRAPGAALYGFDPEAGGLTDDPGPGDPRRWRVRPETVEILRRLGENGEVGESAGGDQVERANRLLAAYLRHVLGREPSSLVWFLGEGVGGGDWSANGG